MRRLDEELQEIANTAVNELSRRVTIGTNRGKFAVNLAGQTVDDRFKGEKQSFKLPDQRGGLLFVFRVFNRISYALVLESDKPLAIGYAFGTP